VPPAAVAAALQLLLLASACALLPQQCCRTTCALLRQLLLLPLAGSGLHCLTGHQQSTVPAADFGVLPTSGIGIMLRQLPANPLQYRGRCCLPP
jgi:hypothetical protein